MRVKTAVSIPEEDYAIIERLRKKRKISRSAMFVELLHAGLASMESQRLTRQYVEGYLRHPETADEVKSFEEASLASFSREDW
jgi:hypothetical protein